jgi:mannose-6-phosphate isomerase-like protein (cupin superfamily)
VRKRWRGLLEAVAAPFGTAALRLRGAPLRQRLLQPTKLPVLACLGRSLRCGDPDVCAALRAVQPLLHWRQNASYADAHLLMGYGYCELVGPNGHWRHDTLALGLLLLAPATTYPLHAHPATEIYHVISGTAEWRCGSEPWQIRRPLSRILHRANVPHAMRTGAEPLLAAYLWLDHLQQPARLLALEGGPLH